MHKNAAFKLLLFRNTEKPSIGKQNGNQNPFQEKALEIFL